MRVRWGNLTGPHVVVDHLTKLVDLLKQGCDVDCGCHPGGDCVITTPNEVRDDNQELVEAVESAEKQPQPAAINGVGGPSPAETGPGGS